MERTPLATSTTGAPREPAGGPTGRSGDVTLDLVIPFLDEEAVLPALLDALASTFSPAAREAHGIAGVRCVFVDDGSRDRSLALLREAQADGALELTVVRLSRNFGHQAAVTAGLVHSRADLVVVMDADLQDPPECVPDLVRAWREGADVVHAQRRSRQEDWAHRLGYAAFYRLYRWLSPIQVPVDSGDFCLMSRRVVDELNRLPEKVRFTRGLRTWIGFEQAVVPYDRPGRVQGRSRYGWWDLYRLATEGIASLSLRPLQLAQLLAILFLLLSVGLLVASVLQLFDGLALESRVDLVLLLVLAGNSLVLFCLYLLGGYVGRTYLEAKGRPTYVVAEVLERPERPGLDTR